MRKKTVLMPVVPVVSGKCEEVSRLSGLDAPSPVLTDAFLLGVEYGRRVEAERIVSALHAGSELS
ncbi:hypothetical protein [Bifidobacterium miconisargentati]|uniref:hypothetical protein n=1 Tax=Bifidobacterium miconisargentati TaxID=2834437 RepID=UPI001BDCA0CB|nr:hypothetical protein [Bifidobacterium miconisargentati]MBW3089252.1 hypothetical protein [Bifidobacterium miconisargentati]